MRLARREGFGPPLRRPVCSCIFQGFMVYSVSYLCRSDGMADVTDSKSVGSDTVWVRVPPSAPRRSKVRFAPTSFFCLRQKRRHPHAPLLLLSNCDPLCWLAVGRPPCGRHSSPIGGLGGSPFLLGQGAVRFAPASFFCLRQKKTPSARSLAPPFQLRPALLARSWQAALRAAFFSNRRSRGVPVPSRLGAVRFAPIFFVPGKKRHPHARPAILRCGFSIPYFLRSLKTRQALRPFPFSLDVLRAWFVSNLQKKCPVLHLGTFLFLPSCYILCIERNIPQ